MSKVRNMFVGEARPLERRGSGYDLHVPVHHLTTHGVVLGMTGSGKTGLVMVMIEEALRNQVPVLVIDVKGDLPNLLLSVPSFDPAAMAPTLGPPLVSDERTLLERAAEVAEARRVNLASWNLGEADLQQYVRGTHTRIITPGSNAGELLHMFAALERRSALWDTDPEVALESLSTAISLVLRLIGRHTKSTKNEEHALLMFFAERRLSVGLACSLTHLLKDVMEPPVDMIGEMTVDQFIDKEDRRVLAAALNSLLVSPRYASWRQGTALDVKAWMTPTQGRTPVTVFSVAHLDDDLRAMVLGVLLGEVLSWVRTQPGTQDLRALVVFDEIYGYLPAPPHAPATKPPLVALIKQARAYGVGLLLASQNPMDLDYRVLSNAGLWCIGRLQTDADRKRVVDSLSSKIGGSGLSKADLSALVKKLVPRWFVMRDIHNPAGTMFVQPRHTLNVMRGPMTRDEIRSARAASENAWGAGEKAAE